MYKEGRIKDVYEEGIVDEFRKISELVEEFNHVAMDTEFPGIVHYSLPNQTRTISPENKKLKENFNGQTNIDNSYALVKKNVEDLKLIQVGITLSDAEGNFPEENSTWQFNFNFDKNNDFYSAESLDLLENAGIDFKTLLNKGTNPHFFAENLIPSGLILNENVHWITFHGVYDFAYLLKNITNTPLPEDETMFTKNLECYFPNFYDVRYLINNNNFLWMKGSLTKIANLMDIKRLGSSHQAGSDSLITSKLFFKLLDTYPDHIDLLQEKNKIFGLNYRICEESEGINSNSMNNMPITMNFNNMYNKNPSYSSLQHNYNNEQNYGMINNNNNLNLNQNGFPRMANFSVNNINNLNNQNYPINQLNHQGNNMNMIRNSDSPTKFNNMINNLPNNNMNRNNNMMNMQGIKQNSANNSSNNLMYYPAQSNYNNLNNNYNNNPYNNQGYNPQMNYNNTNNMSGPNMYKNSYNGQLVGDYNNYMNPYYIQNGFKNNNNNIATI